MRTGSLLILLLTGSLIAGASSRAVQVGRVSGHYTDQQLGTLGSFTLPRTLLYDKANRLVPHEAWPEELADVKKRVGDAYCCVSKEGETNPGGGPPKDCVKLYYGADIAESFKGLLDADGSPITLKSLPSHKWLLVEYFATWCQPCVAERRALEKLFATTRHSKDYLWLSIDMSRLSDVQAAAKKPK
jgi:hypothetical protein